jgi:invasion protein IalB
LDYEREAVVGRVTLFVAAGALVTGPCVLAAEESRPPVPIYSPWTKVCGPVPAGKKTCFVVSEGRSDCGSLLVGVALIEQDDEPKTLLRVTLPSGTPGTGDVRAVVDGGEPIRSPLARCRPNGCDADYVIAEDFVARMKGGQALIVEANNDAGRSIRPAVPLAGFAKTHEGPPARPKEMEARQLDLETIKRHAEREKRLAECLERHRR